MHLSWRQEVEAAGHIAESDGIQDLAPFAFFIQSGIRAHRMVSPTFRHLGRVFVIQLANPDNPSQICS